VVQTEYADTLPGARPAATPLTTRAVRAWALFGVAALFGRAIWQLGGRGVATLAAGLQPAEWLALAVLTAIFVYGEGFRALQLKWLPRVFERVESLQAASPLPHRLFAPLYAMSLVGAPLRSLIRAWLGVAAIIMAVMFVSRFPDPWRGIVDLAVASALAWALAALLARSFRR
jgi:hypothetical protein